MTSLGDFNATSIDGREVDLAAYQGQALLVVNTASQCGFTSQYAGLQELHDTYGEQGFAVLGFPCDQFGNQEPGGDRLPGDHPHRDATIGDRGVVRRPIHLPGPLVGVEPVGQPVGDPVRRVPAVPEHFVVDDGGGDVGAGPLDVAPGERTLHQREVDQQHDQHQPDGRLDARAHHRTLRAASSHGRGEIP